LCVDQLLLNLPVVDGMAIEMARRKRAQRFLEGESLAVSFAISFGFDAIVASRLAFVTFDTAPTAR
jgi:hypothetical protein